MVELDARPSESLARAISPLRFALWISIVTAGCLAWYHRLYSVSTPLMGFNWAFLQPRAELLKPIRPTKSGFLALLLVLGILVGIGGLIALVVRYVAPYVEPSTAERIATHPATIGSLWFSLLYFGAQAWKRQLESRDA